MKTVKEIRNEIGFSQILMAQLLGISRSQLSKVEQGKAKLHQKAIDLLEEIDREVLSKPIKIELPEEDLIMYSKMTFEKLFRENELEIKRLTKKIDAAKKKQQSKSTTVQFGYQLNAHPDELELSKPLMPKAFLSEDTTIENLLMEYEIQLWLLNKSTNFINQKLREFSKP